MLLCAAAAAALLLALIAPGARAAFTLGLQDQAVGQPGTAPTPQAATAAIQAVRASTVRISLFWAQVAPGGTSAPRGFRPTDPSDPHYTWSAVDAAVRRAAQNRQRILLDIYDAPQWAQGPHRPKSDAILDGAWNPSAAQFKAFATAAARRYSGRFADPLRAGATLPRVSAWEIWNEENLPWYLAAPHLVDEYRALLNAGYSAIKGVSARNTVVMGGLAPVSFLPPRSVSPLTFAAQLMCLRRVGTRFARVRHCAGKATFDVFAHHPYSLAATPTKHAYRYDDVLVADMPKIAALVSAADRLHTVKGPRHHPIWVTEFAWYTNPPNRTVGDSAATAARYVAYSMYEMWRAGVSLVVWYTTRDTGVSNGTTVVDGAGLETKAGATKKMMSAFGFPVVASVSGGRGYAWGRAPVTSRTRVTVQRLSGHRWRSVATARTGSDGVFQARFGAPGNGLYRAVVAHGPTSLPYNSLPIPPKRTHLFSSG